MKFLVKPTAVIKVEADLVAVFAYLDKEGNGSVFTDEARFVDKALSGMLSEVAQTEDFEAKPGKLLLIHSHGKIPAKRVLLVGLGKIEGLSMSDWQTVAATIGRKGKEVAAKRVALVIPVAVLDRFDTSRASQGAVEGVSLGTYVFNRHKSEEERRKEKVIEEVYLLSAPGRLESVSAGISRGEIVGRAVVFARDLVNEPPSVTTPRILGEVAGELTKGQEKISAQVSGRKDMEALGMGALLGIARGSDEEPKFIQLTYRGGGRKTIALVGKGITFDTGGLSLKSPESMETMKLDMAGAAAILGIFKVLPMVKPKATVVGLISATENMPSGRAIKPGDVVRAMNGKTIEIINTDAEGRVVLADALSFAAARVKPDVLIDLATLTGACMVALGEEISGLFTSNDKLATALEEAAAASGEKVWQLPLAREYKDLLKSTVADVKNISGKKYGGAITAALFLAEFVPEKIAWAHLDIAGPAFAETDAPLTPRGGTGFGVRMMLQFIQSFA